MFKRIFEAETVRARSVRVGRIGIITGDDGSANGVVMQLNGQDGNEVIALPFDNVAYLRQGLQELAHKFPELFV